MAPDLPKRLFRHGHEPEIKQINNRCCLTLLDKLEAAFPSDYDTVRKDPVFAQIMAIHKNCLNFSGRLVHRFMCNQLATSRRYEHWFTFAKRPLRFSLQEFHAITGLKYQYDADDDRNYDDWHDDGRYWSKLLKRRGKINLHTLKKDIESGEVNKWHQDDRVRLVYLCVIAGVIMARDDKRHISHTYIKLVMNLDKLRKYPWGLHSYDLLVESITKVRVKLNRKISYTLDGFSYALQIWIMEAIPDIGILLGKKLKEDRVDVARCSNWIGAAKVSYDQIKHLENSFDAEDVVYPYISIHGNMDVVDSVDFIRDNEMRDVRVEAIKDLIRENYDWTNHMWEADESWINSLPRQEEEPEHHGAILDEVVVGDGTQNTGETSVSVNNEVDGGVKTHNAPETSGSRLKRRGKRIPDHGAESRKQKLLCQRSAIKVGGLDESTKTFIKGLIESSLTALEERMDKKTNARFEKLERQCTEMQEVINQVSFMRYKGEPPQTAGATTSGAAKDIPSPIKAKVRRNKNLNS